MVSWYVNVAFLFAVTYCDAQPHPTTPAFTSEETNFLSPQLHGEPGNPGFAVRISPKGLTYINTMAGNILNSAVTTMPIPDIKVSDKKGYIKAMQMKITKFQAPLYRYSVGPQNWIHWMAKGGKISLKGRYTVHKKRLLKVHKGKFTVRASNLELSISACLNSVADAYNWKPQLVSVQCHAAIRNRLHLHLHGKIQGWILNLFRRSIAKHLKESLEKHMYNQARTFVVNDVNAKLRTIPMSVPIGQSFQFNSSLTSTNPSVSDGSIISYHRGEVTYKHSTDKLDFYPENMQIGASASKMLYFYGSDYIVNSFFSHAHNNGLLVFTTNGGTSGLKSV